MSKPHGLAILGSTGSIGRSTLAVVALHPERFRVAVLGAHSSWQAIVEQAAQQSDTQLITLLRFSEAARLSAGAQPKVYAEPTPAVDAARDGYLAYHASFTDVGTTPRSGR